MSLTASFAVAVMLSAPLIAATEAPSDEQIANFWRLTRARLVAEPMDSIVEPIKDPLPYRKFRVTLRGLDGVRFRAYLAIPVRGESPAPPLPAIITAPGYGGTQQGIMLD